MSTPIGRALRSNSLAFSNLPKSKRYAVMALVGFTMGAGMETFMCLTGFYKVTTQITARRWYEQTERRKTVEDSIYEEAQRNFQLQLERRRGYGGTDLSQEVPKEMLEKPPNLFDSVKDTVYPSDKGWGAWDKSGAAKAQ